MYPRYIEFLDGLSRLKLTLATQHNIAAAIHKSMCGFPPDASTAACDNHALSVLRRLQAPADKAWMIQNRGVEYAKHHVGRVGNVTANAGVFRLLYRCFCVTRYVVPKVKESPSIGVLGKHGLRRGVPVEARDEDRTNYQSGQCGSRECTSFQGDSPFGRSVDHGLSGPPYSLGIDGSVVGYIASTHNVSPV